MRLKCGADLCISGIVGCDVLKRDTTKLGPESRT
jgi:hypothetical protein